jgi:ankyrin repeat protein
MADRVRLLLEHGVDPARPFEDGSVPVRRARVNGQDRIARLLVAAGAPQPPQDPVADLIGAVLSGDRRAARQLAADPQVLERARRERPGVVVWAAANRLTGAVELLADLGFDLDALGRGDSPVEQPWESALHHAADNGDLVTARLLLDRGARTDLRDARFGATPLGWAQHAGQADLVRLLTPLTPS